MIVLVAGPQKPPRFVQGLGLPYLGAVLEEQGFEVKIMDLYPSTPDTDDLAVLDDRLAAAVAGEEPTIVGVTIHTPDYPARVRLARHLRKHLPEALLMAGGHHPTAEPEDLLHNSDFDVCVTGEGERTLLGIAQRVARADGRSPGNWLRSVRGIVYKQGDQIVRTSSRPPVANLDGLPLQAHHLLGLEDYTPHPLLGVKSTGILTYRGCPKRCAFCCNPQGSWVRRRSPSMVVDEMAWVVKDFAVHGFNIYDNLFGLDREHSLAVCDEILRRRLDVVWGCWTAGDLVDVELAGTMKAAGCIHVGFGAESGDDEVLARARRGFTAAQHQSGIRALRSAGLRTEAFFMVGLPGESESSVQRTVEFAERCGAEEVCLSLYRPWPGTAIWREPERFDARITRGPNFEAYIETEHLSRAAILEQAEWAGNHLQQCGLMEGGFLRYDRYAWE